VKLPPIGALRSELAKLARLERLVVHAVAGLFLVNHKTGDIALPPAGDLSQWLPPRKNQGQSGSCTCHSFSAAVTVACGPAGVSVVDASPHVLYSLSGRLEAPDGALQDNGRQLLDVWAAFQAHGLAPQHGPTPDGRNSDVWTDADTGGSPPGNVNDDATAEQIAAAGQCRPKLTLSNLDPTEADVEDQVCAAISAKMPVWLGTEVGQQFQTLTGDTEAQPDSVPNDPNGGGHALFIVAYRTLPDGSREYRVINSWGDSWDENGECWASGAWVRGCWELHAIGVTK
jgi:hypothetical protein